MVPRANTERVCWLDLWAAPGRLKTSHQRLLCGMVARVHSRTTGWGMPARQRAPIYLEAESERGPFVSGCLLVTAQPPMELPITFSLGDNSPITFQSNSVGQSPPCFTMGCLGSNHSSGEYHLSDHRGRAGCHMPPCPHL